LGKSFAHRAQGRDHDHGIAEVFELNGQNFKRRIHLHRFLGMMFGKSIQKRAFFFRAFLLRENLKNAIVHATSDDNRFLRLGESAESTQFVIMTQSKSCGIGSKKIATSPDLPASTLRDAEEFNKRGLFIGGCPKSGTTLLISLLDGHPQLVVLPEETNYLEDRQQYLKLNDYQSKLRLLLERLWKFGADTVCREKSQGGGADVRRYNDFDYGHFRALAEDFIKQPGINDSLLLSEVIRAYGIVAGCDLQKCVRWVEKTPRTETHAEIFDELFPEATLIQIMRDPRAVFASRKNLVVTQKGRYTEAHRLTRLWNRCAREIPRLRRDPSRFLVVRYEDLVKNPRDVLERICEFGGFNFHESMLKPTRAGNGWQGNSAFYKEFNGISAAPAEKWKSSLTEDEIWWIELHCRKGMELADYPLQTNARFSLKRWLKRLPSESPRGYLRARRDSLRQGLRLLKECCYNKSTTVEPRTSLRRRRST
jgi:hypothetical protein